MPDNTDPTPAPAPDPTPAPAPAPEPTPAPTLEDLAKAVEKAESDYSTAKATADASMAKAHADQAAEASAHVALKDAISALMQAATAADPG